MNIAMRELIDRLEQQRGLTASEYTELIQFRDVESVQYLESRAESVTQRGRQRVRYCGLIDLTNYCRQDCYFCALRRENRFVNRFRLQPEDVLACCDTGYLQGIHSFLIQGGEDLYFTPERVAGIVAAVKEKFPDSSVILALGEKSKPAYQKWRQAGAQGYVLNCQTFQDAYYKKLHPSNMSLLKRKQCLWELKELGYQLGTGFLVGTPGQKISQLAEELVFIGELSPDMVFVEPFLPAPNTPFEKERSGNIEITCFLLSILRLMMPQAFLPVTTTLAMLERLGSVRGVRAGANVVLPDLTPRILRENYHLYRKQIFRGADGREGLLLLRQQLREAGYEIAGDSG